MAKCCCKGAFMFTMLLFSSDQLPTDTLRQLSSSDTLQTSGRRTTVNKRHETAANFEKNSDMFSDVR